MITRKKTISSQLIIMKNAEKNNLKIVKQLEFKVFEATDPDGISM